MQHQAKKSLGQNFLKSKEAIRTICDAGRVNENDIVIEIGPGKGALTEELLKRGSSVIAIEKDGELIEILNERFKKEITESKLEIIDGDCLDFEFSLPLVNRESGRGELKRKEENLQKYKIIANIPYNITGAIIKKFLSETENKPELMALLVQKEVAERIVARDNKESILSLSVKAYGVPKYIMKVGKKYFSPSPKVDSAIILIDNVSNKNFKNKNEEELFFKIIKAGFAHKRKVLIKNIEVGLPHIDKKNIEDLFQKLKINPKARAEDLSFSKWTEILHILSTDK